MKFRFQLFQKLINITNWHLCIPYLGYHTSTQQQYLAIQQTNFKRLDVCGNEKYKSARIYEVLTYVLFITKGVSPK